MNKITKILKQYIFSILSLSLIIYLSFMEVGGIATGDFFEIKKIDMIIHFIMYSFLTTVIFSEHHFNAKIGNEKIKKLQLFFILAFTGTAIEFLQPVLSSRSKEFFDFVANFTGITAGYYLYKIFVWVLKK